MLQLKVKKNHPQAKLPEKAYIGDAGFDLFSVSEVFISSGDRAIIKTGIHAEIPFGYYGDIRDRSGNSTKRGLHVIAGIVDSQYRGEILVCIQNLSNSQQIVYSGDKIAQMLILPVPVINVIEVDSLDETERGEKGFGSSDSK